TSSTTAIRSSSAGARPRARSTRHKRDAWTGCRSDSVFFATSWPPRRTPGWRLSSAMRNVPSRLVVAITVVLVLAGSALAQSTTRVSVVPAGTQGDRSSGGEWLWPSDPYVYVTGLGVSGDGRYAVFCSAADNLVAGATN